MPWSHQNTRHWSGLFLVATTTTTVHTRLHYSSVHWKLFLNSDPKLSPERWRLKTAIDTGHLRQQMHHALWSLHGLFDWEAPTNLPWRMEEIRCTWNCLELASPSLWTSSDRTKCSPSKRSPFIHVVSRTSWTLWISQWQRCCINSRFERWLVVSSRSGTQMSCPLWYWFHHGYSVGL